MLLINDSIGAIVTRDMHLIPGRLRIKVPGLKRNHTLGREFEKKLASLTGVKKVEANPSTGKALIFFNPAVMSYQALVKAIKIILNVDTTPTREKEVISLNTGFEQVAATALAVSRTGVDKNTNCLEVSGGNLKTQSSPHWHTMENGEVLRTLSTNMSSGLTKRDALDRLERHGPNQFASQRAPSLLSLLLEPLKDFMTRLLIGAAGVSLLVGEMADAVAIVTIVGLQAVMGAIQGYRAEKSLAALKELSAPKASVLREGVKASIPAQQLVPGDIIMLETGDKVPSDARILEAADLMVEESSLTGESVPVYKTAGLCQRSNIPLADKSNMVFMGTSVTGGRAAAVVVNTGMDTEMGRIASMLEQVENERTPLQVKLETLGKQVTTGALAVVAGIASIGLIRGRPVMEMLRTGISLAVGAIPESLPAIVTIALAFGVQRMVKKNAIVRRLPAVETLGSATVVCTDKTGTLTKNEMTVKEIYTDGISWQVSGEGYRPVGNFLIEGRPIKPLEHDSLVKALTVGVLCNNAQLRKEGSGKWVVQGDPTEGALLTASAKAGLWWEDLQERFCRSREITFDSERKMMSVICRSPDEVAHIYTKGAPDALLAYCNKIVRNGTVADLDLRTRNQILSISNAMAGKAFRVLALAYRPLDSEESLSINQINNFSFSVPSTIKGEMEKDMIFSGLVGMMDPPRSGVKEAISRCHRAGVKVVMITGDHENTARAIGQELNILNSGLVISGEKLENMSDLELAAVIDKVDICSRTSPTQKLRIVKAFKSRGCVVAMTGDGVNDAPALKEADIGLAMGRTGTDVTRESASIVLSDDNFKTIVDAIAEGRTVGDNIRKSINYVLSGNLGEVLAIFMAAVSGLPVPLVPGQILWVNLISEGFPAMALAADPPQPGIMHRQPDDSGRQILTGKLARQIMTKGLMVGATTFGIFGIALKLTGSLAKARTLAFANLVMSQVFNVFDSRRNGKEIKMGEGNKSKYLLPSAIISAAMLLPVIYLPFLRPFFSTVPMSIYDWVAVVLTSGVIGRLDRVLPVALASN